MVVAIPYVVILDADSGRCNGSWAFMRSRQGLVNGFHGAVLLPNGAYLGGGNVGTPYTLGCVMSDNDNARRLYEWADEGTIVEIISSEFQPQSDLGRTMMSQTFNSSA